MPTDQPIRSVSSSLRWHDCPKAIPQSPPAPPELRCSAPPTRSISRRHVLRDDESLRANVRAGPRLPPSTLSLKSQAVRSRLNRDYRRSAMGIRLGIGQMKDRVLTAKI